MNINKDVNLILKGLACPVSFLICNLQPRPATYVTFQEIFENEVEYSNDIPRARYINVQVNIYTSYGNSTNDLKEDIIARFKNAKWVMSGSGIDLYETDTNIHHKILEFKHLKEEK